MPRPRVLPMGPDDVTELRKELHVAASELGPSAFAVRYVQALVAVGWVQHIRDLRDVLYENPLRP